MQICKNCNKKTANNFCSHCGTAVNLKRIDRTYIINEFASLLYFERGLLYTFKELLLHPGESVKAYLTEDRNKLTKPVVYIIVTSIIYSILNQFLNFDKEYIDYNLPEGSTAFRFFEWMQVNYGYSNIILGLFIAFWTMLLYRKHKYNYFEITSLLFYIMGQVMLMLSIILSFEKLIGISYIKISSSLTMLYIAWAIGQFFGKRKIFNYLKALLVYTLGTVTFILIAMAVSALFDLFK